MCFAEMIWGVSSFVDTDRLISNQIKRIAKQITVDAKWRRIMNMFSKKRSQLHASIFVPIVATLVLFLVAY